MLRGLSLEVPKGRIVAVLGANGAGKSTTLKAISGLLKSEDGAITRGEITFGGERINSTAPDSIVRRGIFQVMEGRRIVADMTVLENLRVGAFTRRDGAAQVRRDIEMVYEYFPRLKERTGLAGYLSGGEQQMLAIGRALMARPQLILMDEPSMGLSPLMVKEVFSIVRKLNQELGVTILLVEQNAYVALQVASYGYIMEQGKVVLDGTCAGPVQQRGRQRVLSERRWRRRTQIVQEPQVVQAAQALALSMFASQDFDAADAGSEALATWLQALGLERYAAVFEENDVDLEALGLLGEPELEGLGLSLGHRKKLLSALAALHGGAAEATPESHRAAGPVSVAAERRQLTVLFCDLVGSTELSRRLDLEDYRELVRSYQSVCAAAVSRFDGHIAQYLGDGLLVYFGYPKAREDDAQRAVRAALAMADAVALLDFPSGPLAVRVGIHTGVVVVGEVGAGAVQEQLALGDTPNLAARLQSLATPGSVVLSERTRQLTAGGFVCRDLGAHALKGIDEPVHAWLAVSQRTDGRFEHERDGPLAPMVGRELEFAVLLHAWERAKSGRGQVVLLCGEPGIGKSRIWQALRERLGEEGIAPWQYQCSPDFANSAFYLAIDYFERALKFEREPSLDKRLDKLHHMLQGYGIPRLDANLIGQLLCLPAQARYGELGMTPQKQKAETIRALNDVIEAAARRRPVVMLFEDLHWADPTSLESLEALRSRMEHLPLLLVATCRSEFRPQWIGQPAVTALTLGRLAAEQTRAIVARVAGGKDLPEEILEQIVAKTDGIPLFAEELTKAILESGLLRAGEGGYELAAPLASLAIPSTLRDSLMARLDRLAPVKEVAQIAACIGREFQPELLYPDLAARRKPVATGAGPIGCLRAGVHARPGTRRALRLQARAHPGSGLRLAAEGQAYPGARPDRRIARPAFPADQRQRTRAAGPALQRGGPHERSHRLLAQGGRAGAAQRGPQRSHCSSHERVGVGLHAARLCRARRQRTSAAYLAGHRLDGAAWLGRAGG